MFYPIFKTRLASTRNSARLVPMRERQNTAMSTEASRSGTWVQRMCISFPRIHRECIWIRAQNSDTHSHWPCRRPSQAHRPLPGRSCALCSSRCELFYNRHSRNLQPLEREIWSKPDKVWLQSVSYDQHRTHSSQMNHCPPELFLLTGTTTILKDILVF